MYNEIERNSKRSVEEASEKPLLLSVPEAAHLLGIGVTFTWIMVRRGELPTVKLGRRVLIPRIALEQLASASRTERGGV